MRNRGNFHECDDGKSRVIAAIQKRLIASCAAKHLQERDTANFLL
jgi:hypothetical protein